MTNTSERVPSEDQRSLADLLHVSLPAMCEISEELDAPPCWTLAGRLLASEWLAERDATNRFVGKADTMASVLDPKGPIWKRMHGDGWDGGYADGQAAAAGTYRDGVESPTNPYRD